MMGRPSSNDELPWNPQISLQPFEKWAIDFVRPIQPPREKTGAWYIITVTEYLTRQAEVQPMKDRTSVTSAKFIFEYVLTRFACQKNLMSDHSKHFLNEMINVMTEELQVYHQKSTPFHLQANGMVEDFNKVLEDTLTKVCNSQRNDWDVHIPAVLWGYK